MKKPEQESPLHLHPRETEVISLTIPKDALASLKQVAAQRDMSYQALLKLYIGQGLRQDLARLSLGSVCWKPLPTYSHTTFNLMRKSHQSCEKSERHRSVRYAVEL